MTEFLIMQFLKGKTLLYLRILFIRFFDDGERFLHSLETYLRMTLLKTIICQNASSHRGAKFWKSLERETKLVPYLPSLKKHRFQIFKKLDVKFYDLFL